MLPETDAIVWALMALVALSVPSVRAILFAVRPVADHRPSSRILSVDAARGAAILAVLGIHALYFPIVASQISVADWSASTLLNNLLRFAVPVFLITSGQCIGPWPSSPAARARFYGTKLRRVVLPYVPTSVLLSFSEGKDFKGVAIDLLAGTASPPLYFVVVLIQIYAVYPLLYAAGRRFPKTLFWGTFFAFSASSLTPWGRLLGPVPLATPYLFLFVFGMLSPSLPGVSSERIPLRPPTLMVALYASLNFAIFAAVILVSTKFATGWYTFCSQFAYSIPALLLLLGLSSPPSQPARILLSLGRHSLWIFMLHYPLQKFLWEGLVRGWGLHPLASAFLLWLSVALLSAIAVAAVPKLSLRLFSR